MARVIYAGGGDGEEETVAVEEGET